MRAVTKLMSLGGVKQRLLIDIINLLFGEPAAILAESIAAYGPCPLGLAAQMCHFPIDDAKTVALSMYSHGVLNISSGGRQQQVSLSTLPAYILSAPSILLDQVMEQFGSQALYDALRLIMFHGIVEFDSGKKKKNIKPTSIDYPDGFKEATDKLIEMGLLIRRPVECESFSTGDVFSLGRRIDNISISKKRTANQAPQTNEINDTTAEKMLISNDSVHSLTINWNGVATYLRGRYIVQFSQVVLKGDFTKLLEIIVNETKCADYALYQRMMNREDDALRNEVIPYSRLEYTQVSQQYKSNQNEDLFKLLDDISSSQMGLLKNGDGTFWDVTTPKCIRDFQIHHIEMYLEQNFSPFYRRCFNQLRSFVVANKQQIQDNALLSEKDAGNSLFSLCKLGFAQMQSLPRSATDRSINEKSNFAFRYDEEAAIEAYRLIIGEHARRFLSKITQLHKEYEQNEQMEVGNMTAVKTNEKKEKHLCCFNASYIDAMKVFILFAEM